MYDVILVDDETLIRATLRNIIDWEAENFRIVLDASNGKQAFDFIRGGGHFDLLITDMKMPVMDGIDLLRNIQPYKKSGCILALSSYNDFYLVREAFRLGATDYILKTDIGQQNFLRKIQQTKELLDKLKSGGMDNGQSVQTDFSQVHYTKNLQTLLEETLCGKNNNPEDFLSGAEEKGIPCGNYSIAVFEMDNFLQEIPRFSDNTSEDLVRPICDFVRQLPQTSKCVFTSLSPARYVMFCPTGKNDESLSDKTLLNICRQMISMWKNYMNISFTAGISALDQVKSQGNRQQQFLACFDNALVRQTMKYVLGQGQVFSPEDDAKFPLKEALAAQSRYYGLYCGIRDMNGVKIEQMREEIVTGLYMRDLKEAQKECLFVIYQIASTLNKYNISFWNIFQQDENYYEKILKCSSIKELEIWMINYLRVLLEYMEKQYSRKQDDIMLRARKFIVDNYANPELSASSVATYTGLSEKYFSTRFTKETGSTFIAYLTDLRMMKAKELLLKTDFKTYEIAALAGYNSAEHFIRVFKKNTGITPSEFRSTR